jgi:protease-4
MHMSGARTVIDALEAMVAEPRIRAIVVRVDSPGGAVLASDQIWRAIRRAREHKPVIASMGQVAASGGYYVASAADEIWADPSTITGSIGIFYGKVDVAELAGKLGVGIEHFSRGTHAGANSMWRPFTPEERASLTDLIRSYYRTFLERVAESRGMGVEQVDALARGRVWSGDQAVANGLVDRLGGLASALARARQRAGLGRDVDLVLLPQRKNSLVDYVLGGVSVEEPTATSVPTGEASPRVELPSAIAPLVRSVGALHVIGSGRPMALMPYELVF